MWSGKMVHPQEYLSPLAYAKYTESKELSSSPAKDYQVLYPNQSLQDQYSTPGKEKFKEQFGKLMDAYITWGNTTNVLNTTLKDNLTTLKTKLFLAEYSGNQTYLYFSDIKTNLESIWFQLQNNRIPLEKRKKNFIELVEQFSVCAPGLFTHVDDTNFNLNQSISLTYWLAELRKNIIKQFAEMHIAEQEVKKGNTVHVHSFLLQYANNEGWNPPGNSQNNNDIFLAHAKLKLKHFLKFHQHFIQNYHRASIISCIATNLVSELHAITNKDSEQLKKDEGWFEYSPRFIDQSASIFTEVGITIKDANLFELNDACTQIRIHYQNIESALLESVKVKMLFKNELLPIARINTRDYILIDFFPTFFYQPKQPMVMSSDWQNKNPLAIQRWARIPEEDKSQFAGVILRHLPLELIGVFLDLLNSKHLQKIVNDDKELGKFLLALSDSNWFAEKLKIIAKFVKLDKAKDVFPILKLLPSLQWKVVCELVFHLAPTDLFLAALTSNRLDVTRELIEQGLINIKNPEDLNCLLKNKNILHLRYSDAVGKTFLNLLIHSLEYIPREIKENIKQLFSNEVDIMLALDYVHIGNINDFLFKLLGLDFVLEKFDTPKGITYVLEDWRLKQLIPLLREQKANTTSPRFFKKSSMNNFLKPEFKQSSEKLARKCFQEDPLARLDQFILVDNAGFQAVKNLLSQNRDSLEVGRAIEYLANLQTKEVFKKTFVPLERLLTLENQRLYYIDTIIFNEFGLAAFEKGFIKHWQVITPYWLYRPALLDTLFTKDALQALELGYFTLSQLRSFQSVQDSKKFISQKISAMTQGIAPLYKDAVLKAAKPQYEFRDDEWWRYLKPKFGQISDKEAQEIFFTQPDSRLEKYLLFDKLGKEFIKRKILLNSQAKDEVEQILEYLLEFQTEGFFENNLIGLDKLIKLRSFELYVLSSRMCNETARNAFMKGYIKVETFISDAWLAKPGFLSALFQPQALQALEKGYFSLDDIAKCIYNEDCVNFIKTKIELMERELIRSQELLTQNMSRMNLRGINLGM